MAAVFTGATLALGIFGFALVTGCGGRASSPAHDHNPGDSQASGGGKGAVPDASGAGADVVVPDAVGGADAVAGVVGSAAGGTPGSAGQSSSGASAGGAAQAGSPSSAGNGASGGGAAGADGSPPEVTAACKSLCVGWIHGCSIWEFAPSCTSDCASDLAVQNGACRDLGMAMLTCMRAMNGSTNDTLCSNVFMSSISACRTEVDAFLACAKGSGSALQPKFCMRAGNPLSAGCAENRACLDGNYSELICADGADGISNCTCTDYNPTTKHNFSADVVYGQQSDDVCLNHMEECMASGKSAP